MFTSALVPVFPGRKLTTVVCKDSCMARHLVSMSAQAVCPHCGQSSSSLHGRHSRTLLELPAFGFKVTLWLNLRRFVCCFGACPHRTFVERLPEVVAPYARKTRRAMSLLLHLALVMGGEPGARIAAHFGLPTSPDTLLRYIRRAPMATCHQVKVLGIDEWAWRKGQTHGTLLCDLEQRRPIDLLADRRGETVLEYLQAHPEVECLSRDRANVFAEAATKGAPQAVQVIDRWHLLHNLREAVQQVFQSHRALPRASLGRRLPKWNGALSGAEGQRLPGNQSPGQPVCDRITTVLCVPPIVCIDSERKARPDSG